MFKRGVVWYYRLETRSHTVIRSTGMTQKVLARAIVDTVEFYGPTGQRDWLLTDALVDGRLAAADLHDAREAGKAAVDALRARLDPAPPPESTPAVADPDLTEHLEAWLKLAATTANAATLARYRLHVRSLMPAGVVFRRSSLTKATIEAWYTDLTVTTTHRTKGKKERINAPASRGTQRKYLAALSSFCSYLVDKDVLVANPVLSMKWPAPAQARMSYLELPRIEALVTAQPEPFGTFSLLLHATGMEVSVAAALRARDFDFTTRSIHARGTKTSSRDRVVFVARWAWPRIEAIVKGLEPDALVFPYIDRWRARDAHMDACRRLNIKNYRQHDARHSYAVRAIKAGASFEHVADQLGHGDTQMVIKVYGRFHPSHAERIAWEDRATKLDRAQAKGRAAVNGTPPPGPKGGRRAP